MIKETLFVGALAVISTIFPPAAPLAIKAAAVTVLALPVDVAINTATGGTPGKTISGDTARRRTAGSKEAAIKCDLYTVVAPYDYIVGINDLGKDHCDRWLAFEARQFDGSDWDGVNK